MFLHSAIFCQNSSIKSYVVRKCGEDDEKSSSSLLNPRTRRKRALGVDPTTTSFSEFEKQVANRLQLKFGIKAIRHKGSGMVVTSVEDLLDIEDLEVEEIREEEANARRGRGRSPRPDAPVAVFAVRDPREGGEEQAAHHQAGA